MECKILYFFNAKMDACPICLALIYDVLQDAYPDNLFSEVIFQKSIKNKLSELTHETYRMIRSHIKIPKLDSIPVLLCVESGLAKSRNYAIDPALVCQFWYLTKLEQIGNLNKIHREHVKTNLK
jgi:hypothetical protein